MRLPTRRVWRAFPELDRFGDAECRRFARQAARRHWLTGAVSLLGGAVGGFVLGGLLVAFALLVGLMDSDSGVLALLVATVTLALGVALPVVGILVARDAWLRQAIRTRLDSSRCGQCGYSLLGMEPHAVPEFSYRVVRCPECGSRTPVDAGWLTSSDLLGDGGSGARGS